MLTHVERDRVAALQRRVGRIESALADWKGGDQGRARAERGALRWVLNILAADPSMTLAEIIRTLREPSPSVPPPLSRRDAALPREAKPE